MCTIAVPIFDALGQLAWLASKTVDRHAFCRVVRRAGAAWVGRTWPLGTRITFCRSRRWGQFVGLNVKPGRLIVTFTCLICSGMPSRIVGILYGPSLSLVTVSAAVIGLTWIFARTSTQSQGGWFVWVCARS